MSVKVPDVPAIRIGSYIDIAGPGDDLWVAHGGVDGYDYRESDFCTSWSTPVISGAIGLLLGADPDLTNEDCYWLLKLAADSIAGRYPIEVGAGIPRLDRAMEWVLSPHGVIHDSTHWTAVESLGVWPCSLRNVECVNETETWQEFDLAAYRVSTTAHPDSFPLKAWPRAIRSSGWRLIDEGLDGNPSGPPHYDGLYYDSWARATLAGDGIALESYTYHVQDLDEWVPFSPFDTTIDWVHYSYV